MIEPQDQLRHWMAHHHARKRTGPKLIGLSYAEAADRLETALKRRITKTMVYDWCKGRSCVPQDVIKYTYAE